MKASSKRSALVLRLVGGVAVLGAIALTVLAIASSKGATIAPGPTPTPPVTAPSGTVVMGLPYDPDKFPGGSVKPGDRLDVVVASSDGSPTYAFTGLLVIKGASVETPAPASASPVLAAARQVLVAVPRQSAPQLAAILVPGQTRTPILRYVLEPEGVAETKSPASEPATSPPASVSNTGAASPSPTGR